MTGQIQIGTEVIRKNYKGKTGIVERVLPARNGNKKAYIRWKNALDLFRRGLTDSHSTISMSALLVASEENLAKQRRSKARRQLKWAIERWETCKDWTYCSKCKTRIVTDDSTCYQCGLVTEVDRWVDGTTAKQIKLIVTGG